MTRRTVLRYFPAVVARLFIFLSLAGSAPCWAIDTGVGFTYEQVLKMRVSASSFLPWVNQVREQVQAGDLDPVWFMRFRSNSSDLGREVKWGNLAVPPGLKKDLSTQERQLRKALGDLYVRFVRRLTRLIAPVTRFRGDAQRNYLAGPAFLEEAAGLFTGFDSDLREIESWRSMWVGAY